MSTASTVAAITLAVAGVFAVGSASAQGDYKGDPSTFSKSYQHITNAPEWAAEDPMVLLQPKNFQLVMPKCMAKDRIPPVLKVFRFRLF